MGKRRVALLLLISLVMSCSRELSSKLPKSVKLGGRAVEFTLKNQGYLEAGPKTHVREGEGAVVGSAGGSP